jgi:hypothetical protein
MAGTALGFLMVGKLPVFAVQAMVFITPLYLLLLVARNSPADGSDGRGGRLRPRSVGSSRL